MDIVTLFTAYEKATSSKEMSYGQYRGRWGIAVNKDYVARQWQKADRIARKLRVRIMEKLGHPAGQPTCAHCGWWKAACPCETFEPHRPLKSVVTD